MVTHNKKFRKIGEVFSLLVKSFRKIYKDKNDCFLKPKYENYKKLTNDNTEVNS